MPYKRANQGARKFLPSYGYQKPDNPSAQDGVYGGDFIDIPLPNEREGPRLPWSAGSGFPSLNRIIRFLKEHVTIEEIILVGLIILLLSESVEDELLLIILVYVLLF